MRNRAASAVLLLVAACSATPSPSPAPAPGPLPVTIGQAMTDAETAIEAYQLAVQIAEAAVLADPGLAPVVNAITGAVGTNVAALKTMIAQGTAAAADIEALVATVRAELTHLQAVAAPAVKAVPRQHVGIAH